MEVNEITESINFSWYLDTMLCYDINFHLNASLYGKRDDFNFSITTFQFMYSNISSSPTYGVVISQLIRNATRSHECILKTFETPNSTASMLGLFMIWLLRQNLSNEERHIRNNTTKIKIVTSHASFWLHQHDIVGLRYQSLLKYYIINRLYNYNIEMISQFEMKILKIVM